MFDDEEDREIFGNRWVERFKAFGRPYAMGAGPLDWFQRNGMPLGELHKQEHYFRENQGRIFYLGFGDNKTLFPYKRAEDYE